LQPRPTRRPERWYIEGETMKRKKRVVVQTPEERPEQELRSDPRRRRSEGHVERIEAELAGKSPGAAGLTVRSKRPRC